MTLPMPYYETPADAPCRVRLYRGDCRELLPLAAPLAERDRVLLLSDNPYGCKANTKGRRGRHEIWAGGKRRAKAVKDRDFKPIAGDAEPFDPAHLLAYPRLLVWGWNHFGHRMPPTESLVVWDKRAGTEPDDGGDCEIAWTNLGGPPRVFRHLWRGTCRASETGVKHLHPSQKPEEFYRWLFSGRGRGKPVARPGDLVVSPYLGSGPEITVAIEWGLDAVGIELEREYLDTTIKHRIEPALRRGRQRALPIDIQPRAEQLGLPGGAL
jgi:site-specific DNA-methyltransferase (adenine-specific)